MSSGGEYRFPVRVYYEDTDAVGVVYHPNYFNFAERARTELLRALGFKLSLLQKERGLAFVVRRCNAEFISPAYFDDELVVVTKVASLGGASIEFNQKIQRTGVDLVNISVQIASVDRDGKVHRLPAELRNILTEKYIG